MQNVGRKHALQSFLGFALLVTKSAFAVQGVCPEINAYTDSGIKILNATSPTHTYGKTIYFCKQDFPMTSLAYSPSNTDLLTGGSRAISQGNTQKTSTILSSIDLAGFTPAALNLNTLTANLPNTNGQFSSPSLFNFYTRIPAASNCSNYNGANQYNVIMNYLRSNASVFQATGATTQTATTDSSSTNSIAAINSIALLHSLTNTTIPATLQFYYANNTTGQYFTRNNDLYCWLGVGTKLTINSSTGNLTTAGEYKISVAVSTYN